jgi:hypothetical protein
MSELSDSQRATLQTFQEIASINDEYLCIQILQQHNWDLDLALNTFVASQSEDTSLASRSEASRPEGNAVRRTNRSTDSTSTSRASSRQSASTAVAPQQEGQQQAPGGLFGLVLVPLRWLFQARPTSLNPEQDTVKFVDEYIEPNTPITMRVPIQTNTATDFFPVTQIITTENTSPAPTEPTSIVPHTTQTEEVLKSVETLINPDTPPQSPISAEQTQPAAEAESSDSEDDNVAALQPETSPYKKRKVTFEENNTSSAEPTETSETSHQTDEIVGTRKSS